MPDISRRSFVELFAGTLVSLPVLAGGLVLAPQVASAVRSMGDAIISSKIVKWAFSFHL